uniref:TF-B3 domain-containing protein n=2 Tax=Brassica oleracea TaxID=3712 RepID=A0A0D3EBL0_BRAOL
RENKGESRCLRQAQKLPVGGRLKQKRELANLGNKQVKEAEKSNKCKKRKVDTDYDDDSEASGTSSLVPEFTLNQKEIIRPGVPKMFAEMHMPKEETVFKFHDPKQNKSWYVVSKIQSRFSRGWPGLVKDFGLKVGDVCTFELIKPTEMILTVDSM